MRGITPQEGFTLVELIVTIAVMAIIAMMAAPSFTQLMAKQKLNANTRELISALSQGRSQAVLLRTNVTVHLVAGTNTNIDFYWEPTSGNQVTAPTSISSITFGQDGSLISGISANTDFVICNSIAKTQKSFALTRMGTLYLKSDGTCS
ncbi:MULTISPECIES: prepilin-type N-terminal cleavage/methylation domain-containing protein [Acinetobacter]|uniref:pilus assembly FimT family protein n=1 Tax=Acinetobacter TaxID=469 RepID=UPI0004F50ECA|nr:prepilin-type N-terminal cleavage/methylation domain-containing protein [Acinetobacter sp. RUH 2624]